MTVLSALCLTTCILSSHALLRNVKPSIDRLSTGRNRDRDTQKTATAFFNFIARQMTEDRDEDCIGSFDRFVTPSFEMCEVSATDEECKTKEEVTQLFCETEHEEAGPIFIRSGFEELDDALVVLSGVWVMQQLDECEELPFDAELHFGPNGRISKWIDTEYDGKPCDVSTGTDVDVIPTEEAIVIDDSDFDFTPDRESRRQRVMEKLYDLGQDVFLNKRDYDGTVDEELDDVLDDFTEDASLCVDLNGEQQCYEGRDAIKQAHKEWLVMKTYDRIDYSKSVSKKGDNSYEIVCTASYEDDDGTCQKSMETDLIRFAGNKIKSMDTTSVMYDDSKNCKKNKKSKKKKMAKAGVVTDERGDVITDFYDLVMDKLFSADTDDLTAKEAVDSFMELTSETMSVCSFDGDDLKKCQDKWEIIEMLREHRKSGKEEGTVFEGMDVRTMSTDASGDRVSVEVAFTYLDEESGCVLERTQMDEFVFDADGKIAEYDNTFDDEETNCEGDGDEEDRLYGGRPGGP